MVVVTRSVPTLRALITVLVAPGTSYQELKHALVSSKAQWRERPRVQHTSDSRQIDRHAATMNDRMNDRQTVRHTNPHGEQKTKVYMK